MSDPTFKIKSTDLRLDAQAIARLVESPDGPTVKLLTRAGVVAERAQKARCPVDTGRMRASVQQHLEHEAEGLAMYIGPNVDYALAVELGHQTPGGGFVPPQAFIRPSLDDVHRHLGTGSAED